LSKEPRAASRTASGSALQQHAQAELQRLSIEELEGVLNRHETVALYDNNARERYERGHIPGARWVGHDQVTAAVLPRDRAMRLVFYCANEH